MVANCSGFDLLHPAGVQDHDFQTEIDLGHILEEDNDTL